MRTCHRLTPNEALIQEAMIKEWCKLDNINPRQLLVALTPSHRKRPLQGGSDPQSIGISALFFVLSASKPFFDTIMSSLSGNAVTKEQFAASINKTLPSSSTGLIQVSACPSEKTSPLITNVITAATNSLGHAASIATQLGVGLLKLGFSTPDQVYQATVEAISGPTISTETAVGFVKPVVQQEQAQVPTGLLTAVYTATLNMLQNVRLTPPLGLLSSETPVTTLPLQGNGIEWIAHNGTNTIIDDEQGYLTAFWSRICSLKDSQMDLMFQDYKESVDEAMRSVLGDYTDVVQTAAIAYNAYFSAKLMYSFMKKIKARYESQFNKVPIVLSKEQAVKVVPIVRNIASSMAEQKLQVRLQTKRRQHKTNPLVTAFRNRAQIKILKEQLHDYSQALAKGQVNAHYNYNLNQTRWNRARADITRSALKTQATKRKTKSKRTVTAKSIGTRKTTEFKSYRNVRTDLQQKPQVRSTLHAGPTSAKDIKTKYIPQTVLTMNQLIKMYPSKCDDL